MSTPGIRWQEGRAAHLHGQPRATTENRPGPPADKSATYSGEHPGIGELASAERIRPAFHARSRHGSAAAFPSRRPPPGIQGLR